MLYQPVRELDAVGVRDRVEQRQRPRVLDQHDGRGHAVRQRLGELKASSSSKRCRRQRGGTGDGAAVGALRAAPAKPTSVPMYSPKPIASSMSRSLAFDRGDVALRVLAHEQQVEDADHALLLQPVEDREDLAAEAVARRSRPTASGSSQALPSSEPSTRASYASRDGARGRPRRRRRPGRLRDRAAAGPRRRARPARRPRALPARQALRRRDHRSRATARALRVGPVVEDEVRTFELRLRYGRSFERQKRHPLILMTQRRRLDAHLAERAAAAGAEFADDTRVEDVVPDNGHVTARVGGRRVGARRSSSAPTARTASSRRASAWVRGSCGASRSRGTRRRDRLDQRRYRGRAVVEVGVVPGGYGWVFPKGDHVNLGVGGWAAEGPRTARPARPAVPRRTDFRLPPSQRCEATGCRCADPVAAAAAGRIAARRRRRRPRRSALRRRDLRGVRLRAPRRGRDPCRRPRPATSSALAAALDPHRHASWTAKRALDRHPGLCFWAARASARVRHVVAGLLRGDVRHPNDAGGIARPPLRLIARLAR